MPFRMITPEEEEARNRAEEQRKRATDSQAADDTKSLQDSQRKRAEQASGGMVDRYRPEMLREYALTGKVDREGTTRQVQDDLKKTGRYGDEDIATMAPMIVQKMMDGVIGKVQGTANEMGVSDRGAAKVELAKEASKDRGRGGFADFGSFYKQLQASKDEKDPYKALTAKWTEQTAKGIDALYKEVVKKTGGPTGGLAGPK
jgi:hypothetical protein